MAVSRRSFLKMAGGASLGAAALPLKDPTSQKAAEAANSASMLYDATLCIGCRACQTACKERSNLPAVTDPEGLYEAPMDLSADTWTMIKLYQGDEGQSFVKNQCMHCVDPACASVCPVGALEKLESGPVIYHSNICIGCRYCMAACPFGIPKAQWDTTLPLIQKCDFCADRLANGDGPACAEACPTGAIHFDTRGENLAAAHERLDSSDQYYPYVYGENEVGGTNVLYLAGVSPFALGFPKVNDVALPSIDWPYMQAVPGVIAAVVTLSTAIYLRTHRQQPGKPEKEE